METKKIMINPVTRIEGHAKISLFLDNAGKISDAQFHVDEFRGFEKFCEGRLYTEMPTITPRICGICPSSHSLASAKACDAIQRVQPTYTGRLLRELIQLGQLISSHALSFFHLSSPDMLLGWDSDPSARNVLGLAAKFPEIALKGIRLRKFGQEVSERLTGKKIHILGVVPGGMAYPLKEDDRQVLLAWIPEAIATCQVALGIFKKYRDEHKQEVDSFANFESMYMGTVGPDGELEMYDGKLRWVDAKGKAAGPDVDPADFLDYVAERPVKYSYLKFPYYKPLGFEAGFYRVGPLARLNVVSKIPTPLAQKEFETYRATQGNKPVHGTFYYHYARLIELLYAVEYIQRILQDPRVTSLDVQAKAERNASQGVGACEAPRGTLFHHYQVDNDGILTKVNLVIATGQNNPAMNRSVLEVARQYVDGNNIKEGALNRVEAAIRCYDPCLSCSTHAIGSMPMVVEVIGPDGNLVNRAQRSAG